MRTADYLLGCGLVSLAVGVGLFQLVIIGLIGLLLMVAAFGLLLAGGIAARSADVSRWRAAGGMAVFVVGVVALVWVGGEVCFLVSDDVRSKLAGLGPIPASRLAVLGLVPVPGLLLGTALRLRGAWSWERCVGWGTAASAAAIAAALVFSAVWHESLLDA